MSRLKLILTRVFIAVSAVFVSNSFADQLPKFNMTPGVTPISRDVYDLHMTVFGIVCVIGLIVFGVLIYSLFKYRKSKGAIAATFHENKKLEIVWAIIPFLILVAVAIPATRVLLRMNDTEDAAVNIKVTGYQWKWRYDYLDEGFGFFSNLSTPQAQQNNEEKKGRWYLLEVDKPLVVPIHTKIRFLVTSNDVIHSWWVPAFGIKRDALPGFVHEAWARIDKPGIYRGQCAELCGVGHGFMPIVVIAKTKPEYEQWVAQQMKSQGQATAEAKAAAEKSWTREQLLKHGQEVYLSHCAVCHKAEGEGMPPAFPALKDSPVATGPVAGHIDIVLHGREGTAMQAFQSQLSASDIAAVITYERSAWGNAQKNGCTAANDYKNCVVQPKQVLAQEK